MNLNELLLQPITALLCLFLGLEVTKKILATRMNSVQIV